MKTEGEAKTGFEFTQLRSSPTRIRRGAVDRQKGRMCPLSTEVASVLRAVLRDEPTAKITNIEGGRVLLRNSGFCPLMTACASMNLPWTWLCSSLGWPFFHGLASAINPKVNLTFAKRRERGDPYCDHIFEIGEGRLIIP